MNNSIGKSIELNLAFLPAGNYEAETWADTRNSDREPKELKKSTQTVKAGDTMKIALAKNGGFVAVLRKR
jgi:alpha-glucosidase